MRIIEALPDTTSEYKWVIHAIYGVWINPLEMDHHENEDGTHKYSLRGYATESKGMFNKYKGYEFWFSAEQTDFVDSHNIRMFSFPDAGWSAEPSYDKVVRTHDEIKAKLDEIWPSSTYDERFALRRLYEYMQEAYPMD